MKKTGLGKKYAWIAAALLVVVCLCIGLFGWQNAEENRLDQLRQEALAVLDSRAGEYDVQKIVLPDTTHSQAEVLAQKLGAKLRITKNGRFATLTLAEGTTIRDVYLLEEYKGYIEDMSPDFYAKAADLEDLEEISREPVRPQYTVSDTAYDRQTYLDYLNLGKTWELTRGNGITVAVIDSGIDTDHPEFAGRISEYSYNATEDKIVKDYGNDWSLIEDEQGHGTAVTGVIAAAMDGSGTVGIAPEVNILVIKAECTADGNFLSSADLVFGLYYAIERDANVVNMSFGAPINVFADAAKLAVDSDIICVAAAGNESTSMFTYPAADPNVIGVGALEGNSWELADYSNYGENTDLVAPGTTYTSLLGGSYGNMSGTSLACPTVAGGIALYLSIQSYVTFDTVTENLYAACYDLGDKGKDWYYGYGALDISALVAEEKGTVTFQMLSDELENMEQVFVRQHTLQNIPEPERLYAVFEGWYYDIDCTEPLNLYTDVFSANLTLYAKWINEDDGVPYTYVELEDGTIEIRSYTGKRRYITIPEYIDGKVVSSIGEDAFAGNTRLREVQLPPQLNKILDRAFQGCSNLVFMNIPDSVTQIGEYAFADNVRLSAVSFSTGSQLTAIGSFAFKNCGNMLRFEIPGTVTSLDGSAFYGTTDLRQFAVLGQSDTFAVTDGVLFDLSGSRVVAYPAGRAGVYTLPNTVVYIGDYAFAFARMATIDLHGVSTVGGSAFAYSRLETLVLPDSVTSLGGAAFAWNSSLREITLSSNVTRIPNRAFFHCSALEQITIPRKVTEIAYSAFGGNISLEKVVFESGSQLTVIGGNAFENTGLQELLIPASVVSIGQAAFNGDHSLISVDFEAGSDLSVIGSEAFGYTYSLKNLALPEGLAEIESYAFSNSGLEEVTLPASLQKLGVGVFASCHSLKNIYVASGNRQYLDVDGVVYNTAKTELVAYPAGNDRSHYTVEGTVSKIGDSAFYGAWNLKTVTLPQALETIGKNGFYDCKNISGYTLPESLNAIEEYAFAYNSSLSSIQIPDNVTQISHYAFAWDYALKNIRFTENAKLPRISYGAFAYTGIYEFRVPASVSTMGQSAFIGSKNLQYVTFAAGSKLESISAYLFKGSEQLTQIIFEKGSALKSVQAHGLEGMTALTTVDFGDAKLENIDNFAFRYCENLQTLKLPETVVNIGRYAFYGCKNLQRLDIPEAMEHVGENAFYMAENLDVYFAAITLPTYLDTNWDNGIRGYYVGVQQVVESGDWKYAVLNSGNIAITEYTGNDTVIDLTKLNLGGDIVTIGGNAFHGKPITAIALPETLQEIHRYAFAQTNLAQVTIPDSVTFIGQYAFYGSDIIAVNVGNNAKLHTVEQYAFASCRSLENIYLPASLVDLGRYAFLESGLKTVDLSACTLTTIPEGAFMGSALTTVVLPDSVSLVDHNAFRDCEDLTVVQFGKGELQLMSNVFYNSGLAQVYIPDNLTYIGEYSLVGLRNLKEFQVSSTHPKYQTIEGLLYSKDGKKLIAAPAGKTGEITLPKELEILGFGAFENSALTKIHFHPESNILTFGYRCFYNAAITEIEIPASVVSFDYYAFAMCKKLTTVRIAENSQLKGIYEGAFYGCLNLHSLQLPDSIVEISDYAFYGCRSLTKLPISENSQIKGIYDYAFAFSGILELELPESLVDIGAYAFRGMNIAEVTIPDANKEQLIIGIGAFADCGELEEITLPFIGASFEDEEISWFGYIFGAGSYEANNTYVPKSLKIVTISGDIHKAGIGAFYGIKTPAKLHLPDTVTDLYEYSFGESEVVYELKNPVSLYGYGALREYTDKDYFGKGLSGYVSLSDSITEIRFSTFEGCSRITGVMIPKSVTDISYYAFRECTALTNIIIPDSVTNLDGYVFYGCSNLEYVKLPDGLTCIPEGIFYGCSKLADLVIPETVTSIENSAFGNCTSLKSISIPKNITSIDYSAFYECTGLSEIINYSTLPISIGSYDYGCIAYYAQVVVNADGSKQFKNGEGFTYLDTADGFRFACYDNGVYRLLAYSGNEDTITLPASIQGCDYSIFRFKSAASHIIIPEGMTSIASEAFVDCIDLTEITIPDGVTSIGSRAFSGCTGLESIDLPDGVTSIGNNAFYHCTNLKQIYIPDSVTEIGSYTFDYCLALESISLPSGLTAIDDGTFSDCRRLASVVIPDSVTSIGGNAFFSCHELEEVVVGQGVKNIEGSAFAYCYSLTNVELPDGLTTIATGVWRDCTNLVSINIPDSVTSIGGYVFARSGVRSVEISDNHPFYRLQDGLLYNRDKTQIVCCLDWVEDVVIPASVTSIDGAFEGNPNLQTVAFEADSKIESIGYDAFSSCYSLVSIILPDSVTSIGEYAFFACDLLTNITIPNGVTHIGSYAFNGTGLTSITIPENVESIGYYAFEDCIGLYEIINHSQLDIQFGSEEHGGITSYARIIVHSDGTTEYRNDGDTTYVKTEDDFLFSFSNGAYQLIAYLGDEDRITLPADIQGESYTIYDFRSAAHYITIPGEVEVIGYDAFRWCYSVTDVTILDGVTRIESSAFNQCHNLKSVTIPESVTTIGGNAFYHCGNLENISILHNVPNNYDTFIDTAYYQNPANWDNGALYIGPNLIDVHAYVEEITVTGAVSWDAFRDCYRLRKVTIGGDYSSVLSPLTNLEQLVLTELPTGPVSYYFGYGGSGVPLTLKTIVLKKGCDVRSADLFEYITGVTIYVEASRDDIQWDKDYPGWNNGNKVYYGGEWINTEFMDDDGSVIDWGYYTVNQMIRQPYVSDVIDGDTYKIFAGWDTDGDGVADAIPPTSVTDICAVALYKVHHFVWSVLHEPSCTEPGIRQKICTDCGMPMGNPEEIPAAGHTEVIDAGVLPTCTATGLTEGKHCSVCGEILVQQEVIPVANHNYNSVVAAPTCTEQGYTAHTCSVCGHSYKDSYTEPTGHNPVLQNQKDATCTEDGYTGDWICADCGKVMEKGSAIPATGHSFGAWTQVKAPSCTADGSEKRTCVCGHSETRVINKLGHDYKSVVTAPTCTEQGYTTHTCSRCDHSYIDSYVNATGHSFGAWTEVKAPTCTADGSEKRTCAYGHSETRTISKLGHDYESVVTAPTCTEQGYTTHTCSRCDDSYIDSYVSATGHSFGAWTEVKAPTCTEKGQERRECANCDHYEVRNVAAKGHTVVIDKAVAPTCTATGLTEGSHCSVCKEVLVAQDVVAATGHSFGDWMTTIQPTEETEGAAERTCKICNQKESKTVPVLSHTHKYTAVVTAPTCTEKGYTTYSCRCGDYYVDSYVNATGHSFGAWTQVKAPSCTADGSERRTCACGHSETRVVDKLGHSYTSVVTAPTCTEQGYTTHTCSRCDHSYIDSYVDAVGHKYVSVVTPPTAEEQGYTTHTCSVCGDSYVDSFVPAFGPSEITSDDFVISGENLGQVKIGLTAEKFLDKINEKAFCKLLKNGREVSGDTVVGTGMILQLIVGEEVKQELTIIVTGDTNGDGAITVTDMLSAKAHVLGKTTLTGAANMAADVNGDGSISITDFILMKAHVLGKETITPKRTALKKVKEIKGERYEENSDNWASSEPAAEPAAADGICSGGNSFSDRPLGDPRRRYYYADL